jgi:sugar phosphate isomerase/epimerase
MFSTLAPDAVPIRVPVERQLQLAQASEFDALDLPLSLLERSGRRASVAEVGERWAAHGLRPGGWRLPFDYQAHRTDFKADLRRLRACARMAGALASPWCYYWIEPTSEELTFSENTAMQVERLRAIADVLGEHGCRLGLEPIGPETLRVSARFEFVHSIPMALDLLRSVDRPNVGLLVDCFHWYTSHASVDDLMALAPEQVVYVHINDAVAGVEVDEQIDNVRRLPGATHVIDLVGFLQALDQIGYDGPVAVEPFDASLAVLSPVERVRAVAQSLHGAFDAAQIAVVPSS